MNSLVIGVVVWNNADDAIECAASLLAQSLGSVEVVFVDNDSRTECAEQLQSYLAKTNSPRLHYLNTGKNAGTSGGFSAIARWAKDRGYTYVGALNADAVADVGWCKSLIDELETHPEAGIATGTMLSRDGKTIDSTGDFYTTWGLPAPRNRGDTADKAPTEAENIFGATGGGYIARTTLYDMIGHYDEVMFMYYEDVDFSFRAQLAGYTVRYTPKAVAYHKRGASSDTVPGLAIYNTFKNLPILFTKNVPIQLWLTILPRFILGYTLILGNAIVHGKGIPALKGWLMSIVYLPHALRERRRIQSSSTVDADYISDIIVHDIPPDQTGLRKFRRFFIDEG